MRVIASGRVGLVNEIVPNDNGDDWLFEVLFDDLDPERLPPSRAETADHSADELELVATSGFEYEPEILVRLEISSRDSAVVAEIERLAREAFPLEQAKHTIDGRLVWVELRPRDHPRPALRALMERLGRSWLVEDDGWYANVYWLGDRFPLANVEEAELFLRPWRDPASGDRLPGEPRE